MRPVQPGGVIDERLRLTPALVSERQMALCVVYTEVQKVIQSLYVGLAVSAISVDSVGKLRGFERKTVTLLLRSERSFGVARIAGMDKTFFGTMFSDL